MHYKSLFTSDIHLGTKQCQVEYLLKFIHDNTFDNVFLVGDIIDIYALSRSRYWPQDHNTFVQKILRMDRKGVNVIYIPGNHDEAVREWIKDLSPFFLGDIEISLSYRYTSVSGKRFLLIHGDCFDGAIRSMGWLYWIGDYAYDFSLKLNTLYNKIRKLFGLQYWSLSAYLKSKVKGAIQVVNNFDELVTKECQSGSYDGVIYGHTHTPSIKTIKGTTVMNIGDMVESCTVIVETMEGKFELMRLSNNTIIGTL